MGVELSCGGICACLFFFADFVAVTVEVIKTVLGGIVEEGGVFSIEGVEDHDDR